MLRLSSVLAAFACLAAVAGCAGADNEPARTPTPSATAQPPTEEAVETGYRPPPAVTRAEHRALMATARERDLAARPIGEVMQVLGTELLGRPYIVGPLDGFEEETLVVRLDSFDCFAYIEALLAMARGVTESDYTFEGYVERTEEQRYRNGEAEGYCSRMHYFTEWIHLNDQRGLVENVTREIGGEPLAKRYGFMTAHREAYPKMESERVYRCIAEVEERLNRTIDLSFVPQDRIAETYDELQAGDLVAAATDIEGLDVTHTGIVYKDEEGGTGLMHASTSGGVKISPDLETYVQGIDKQIGIIVARPQR